MARTHGTRSAYNAGCRCDACREEARLSRARQRAAQVWDPTGFVPEVSDAGVASPRAPAVGVAMTGLAALGVGGCAVWHGATMRPEEHPDPEVARRSRRRWIMAGLVLLVLGGLALRAVAAGSQTA